eukprot:1509210-Ditylum_brightwellii.AAC.1
MKAEDCELFIQAMEEDIERMIDKDIFEVVPCSHVPTYQSVLRTVGQTEEKQNQQVKSTDKDPSSVLMAASNNMA